MHHPTIISSSKLSNYVSKVRESSFDVKWHQVLSSYNHLIKSGFQEPSLFHQILKACSVPQAKSLHASVIKTGFESCNTSIGNSIMDFYTKAGLMDSTYNLFNSMKIKDSISWNILISGAIKHNDFDKGMCLFINARSVGFEPNVSTLVLVVRAIREVGYLVEGQQMHGFMIKTNFLEVLSVQNSVLSMYAEMAMEFARKLFDEMSHRDVITWSVIISGYVKSDECRIALGIFKEMFSHFEIEVDGQMIVSALKACTDLKDLIGGRTLHGFVLRKGFNYDLFVGNTLIDLYYKCNDPDSALQAWKDMPVKNIVSWNSLLSGLVCNEKHSEAINLFNLMQKARIVPDAVTLVNLLQVCKHLTDPLICKCIHTVILRRNHELNTLVINTLIDVYAKCDLISIARKLFSFIKIRDTISWSTMIAAYTHCGLTDEAIKIYHQMIQAQMEPNAITVLNLIEACSYDAELKRPKWAHGVAIRRGFASNAIVGTAILDMYSRYADVCKSERAFNQILNKNVVSFSAMITAYGMNGLAYDAIKLLTEMETRGLKPNSITILSVLSACSHGGLINEGLSIFQQFVNTRKVKPSLEIYSCLVDLLSRAGKLDLAMELVNKLAKEQIVSASVWGALLSGCRTSHDENKTVQEKVVERVLELEPNNSGGYMLASGMYAAQGLWAHAARVRAMVKDNNVKVVAGYSMVHVNNTCCRFVAGGHITHVLSKEIRVTIRDLHKYMKMENIQVN